MLLNQEERKVGRIEHSLGLNGTDGYFIAHQGFYTADERNMLLHEVSHKKLLNISSREKLYKSVNAVDRKKGLIVLFGGKKHRLTLVRSNDRPILHPLIPFLLEDRFVRKSHF